MSNIIEKIQKLQAMAERGEGNEADVAARLARKLMLDHAISMEELNVEEADPLGAYEFLLTENKYGRCMWWKRELAQVLIYHLGCRFTYMKGTSRMTVYGHASTAELVSYLYDVARRQIDTACKARLKKLRSESLWWDRGRGRQEANAFRRSAVKGLSLKLAELKRREHRAKPAGYELVLSRESAVREWYQQRTRHFTKGSWGGSSRHSAAGFAAGKEIQLTPGVSGSGRAPRAQIESK